MVHDPEDRRYRGSRPLRRRAPGFRNSGVRCEAGWKKVGLMV
jgi:hypothetical protein